MKKILIALLVTAVLLASVSALAECYVVATGGDTYIRIGPSLYCPDIFVLYHGYAMYATGNISIDERGVAWYEVYLDYGTAWVSSRYTNLYY